MYDYDKLMNLITNIVNNKKIDMNNIDYAINVNNKIYRLSYSQKLYDAFFTDFFSRNLKYKNVKRMVKEVILKYLMNKAYKIKIEGENPSKNEIDKEFKDVLHKIKNDQFKCIFPINGLRNNNIFTKRYSKNVLITNKNVTEQFASDLSVPKDEFRIEDFVIILTTCAYNQSEAIFLSRKAANIIAYFLNVFGLVRMNVTTLVNIGFSNSRFYDTVVYEKKGDVTASISSPDTEIPFDMHYIDDKCFSKLNKIVSKILNKKKLTPFEEAIVLSTKLIGTSTPLEDNSFSYFKCVSVLECFFEKKNQRKGIKRTLKDKTNAVLTIDTSYGIYVLPKHFYDKRSDVAHGENLDVSNQELFIMKKISSIILMFMLKNYSEFNVNNFKNKINSYINKKSR